MKDFGWVTASKLVQTVVGLAGIALTAYLILLSFSARLEVHDAANAIYGLRISAGIFLVLSIVMLTGVYGLWKEKLWGWWMAFLLDLVWLSVLVYSTIDDGWSNLDTELLALLAISVFPVLMLLLPSVRKHYWRRSESRLSGNHRGNTKAGRATGMNFGL